MQALGFLAIFAGALLLISGVTGSSIASVAKGAPDRSRAAAGQALEGGGSSLAGVTGSAEAGTTGTAAHSGTGPVAPAPSSIKLPANTTGSDLMRAYVRAYAKNLHWSAADWEAVIERESGWNPASVNPSTGAYGLGQFNPEGSIAHPRPGSAAALYAHAGATSPDWRKQLHAMALYIFTRYGNPTNALAHEHSAGWY